MATARWLTALPALSLLGSGCYGMMDSEGGGEISKKTASKGRRVVPGDVSVPAGYGVEVGPPSTSSTSA